MMRVTWFSETMLITVKKQLTSYIKFIIKYTCMYYAFVKLQKFNEEKCKTRICTKSWINSLILDFIISWTMFAKKVKIWIVNYESQVFNLNLLHIKDYIFNYCLRILGCIKIIFGQILVQLKTNFPTHF